MKIELGVLRARVTAMSPAERTFLHDYLTFSNPKGRFSGQGTKLHMLNVLDDSFPSGLWPLLEKAAREEGHEVELEDLRGENPAGLTWPSLETSLLLDALCPWLRWYQREAVQAIVEQGRGIVWCPTGSGKTVIAGGAIKLLPIRWLFVVNDAGLLHQTADSFEKGRPAKGEDPGWPGIGEPVGRIGDGVWSVERVTVATFQTLYARRKKPEVAALLESVEGLIADECFPAGTRIGCRPIEEVRVGDLVPSFNEATGRLEQRRVIQVFRRPAPGLIRLWLADGRRVVCTPGHPFLTPSGWLPAYTLCGKHALSGDEDADLALFGMPDADRARHDAEGPGDLLPALPAGATGGAAEEGHEALLPVRDGHPAGGAPWPRAGAAGADLLLRGLPPGSLGEKLNGDGGGPGAAVPRPDARRQPDAEPRGAEEAQPDPAPHRAPAALDRREGPWAHGAAGGAMAGARPLLGDGVLPPDGGSGGAPGDDLPGPGGAVLEGRGRGGRLQPRDPEGEGAGPAERGLPSWVRVDRVEVLEPGSDGRYGGLCPGGEVFNLEVEGTQTYVADGLVAHNCHTLPAGTFWAVAMRCPAWFRIGLSGTPLARGDKRSSLTIGAIGRVIYRIRPEVLQAEKVLAVPTLRMIRCEQLPTAKTYAGIYSEAIVGSAKRNALLVRMAKQADKPAWLFFRQIDHGKDLLARCARAGINAELVHGSHDVKRRQALVEAQKRGDLDLLICSVVFQTGWDMPGLRAVIIGSGDKSVIATLQRIGRGMRVDKASGKETFEVWDVWDEGHPTLDQHTDERFKAYQKEGYKPEIMEPACLSPSPPARRRKA